MPATVPTLPPQVSPPAFALSARPPHELSGVEAVAYPFTPSDDGPVLGPDGSAAAASLGIDLQAVLAAARPGNAGGEVVPVPVAGSLTNAALRLVLLVGLGEATPTDFRRAGAALARAGVDRIVVAPEAPV